jgi:hypothetical protein
MPFIPDASISVGKVGMLEELERNYPMKAILNVASGKNYMHRIHPEISLYYKI